MGIDPMADAAGQQGLSPYHAMACNPSTLTDPLGLYVKGEAHNGGAPPDYGMEMQRRFPTMPNFMARYLDFGERTAMQSMAEQQYAVMIWRAENRIAEMIDGGAMWASGDDVETLYNYLNVKYYNGLKIGDNIDGHIYAGLDQYGGRIYLSAPGENDEVHMNPSNDLYLQLYLANKIDAIISDAKDLSTLTSALTDIYINKKALSQMPKWFTGPYNRAIAMKGAKEYTSVLSIQLRRLGWQHGGRIINGAAFYTMMITTAYEESKYVDQITTQNIPLNEVKEHYNEPLTSPAFWIWMMIENKLSQLGPNK
ncbi:hypothetical protein D3C71_52680 [compost metagenome]